MSWYCLLVCLFPARCARPGCVSGITLSFMAKQMGMLSPFCVRLFEILIFVKGVAAPRGRDLFLLRTTPDRLGSFYEAMRRRREALRWRLITEVQGSSGLENRAETSGFHSADFLSGLKMVTEPVVLTRARRYLRMIMLICGLRSSRK
ncbi:hypothetical protein Enr17x_52730 [Gimesia fumaroli]|uniref:Uncharacterized protein n=1 Tax=Gimesia fumaroli TaxID=2527976 RepID=A0A518IJE5_9PLAN|nr:hypothetical protein Enr17x_52730 [Gimesia fumaroli]